MIYFLKHLFHAKGVAYRYDQLFDEIKIIKPVNIMEIGVWVGDRAKKMIKLASQFNPTQSVNYYGFDLFEIMDNAKFKTEISKQPPNLEYIKNKLKETSASINLFKGDTTETLPKFVKQLPPMDLIFIDGGHSLETIANDWLYTSKLLHTGSVVIFDDYWPSRTDAGSKVTVDTIDRGQYFVEILPITDFFPNTAFGPLTIQFAKVVKY